MELPAKYAGIDAVYAAAVEAAHAAVRVAKIGMQQGYIWVHEIRRKKFEYLIQNLLEISEILPVLNLGELRNPEYDPFVKKANWELSGLIDANAPVIAGQAQNITRTYFVPSSASFYVLKYAAIQPKHLPDFDAFDGYDELIRMARESDDVLIYGLDEVITDLTPLGVLYGNPERLIDDERYLFGVLDRAATDKTEAVRRMRVAFGNIDRELGLLQDETYRTERQRLIQALMSLRDRLRRAGSSLYPLIHIKTIKTLPPDTGYQIVCYDTEAAQFIYFESNTYASPTWWHRSIFANKKRKAVLRTTFLQVAAEAPKKLLDAAELEPEIYNAIQTNAARLSSIS
jgi:hypothetical protein